MITTRDITGSECNKELEVIMMDQDGRGCFHYQFRHRVTGDVLDLTTLGLYELPPPEDIPCPPCSEDTTSSCSSSYSSSSLSSSSSSSSETVDCGPYDFTFEQFKVFATAVPYFGASNYERLFQVEGCIEDGERGLVTFCLDENDLEWAGMHLMQIGLWQGSQLLYINNAYLEVAPNIFNTHTNQPHGPITMAEIRLRMRDLCPGHLLDEVEFNPSEIAAAIRLPVDYWNETPPPIGITSPAQFPFRYHWLTGACALLLQSASMSYKREDLQYSAGGVTIADKNKAEAYQALGDRYWKEYTAWVQNKKVEINISQGWGSTVSPYSSLY